MSCSIDRPSTSELFNRVKAMMEANVLGGFTVLPESNEWYVVSNDTAMLQEMYSVIDQQAKELDARYACCDNLISMAANDGFYPRPALFAQGYVTITGTAGAVLPDTLEFTFDGVSYISSGSIVSNLPDSGETTLRIRAVEAGTDGNIASTGEDVTGTLDTAVVNVDTVATLHSGYLCGGKDVETCEEFRTRYLDRMAYSPNLSFKWITDKVLDEWPCVTRICERGGACCEADECGTCGDGCSNEIVFYAIFDNTFDCGLAPQCVMDELNAWLFGERAGYGEGEAPIGVCGEAMTATGAVVDVTVHGTGCATSEQRSDMREAIEELFTTLCPSQDFYGKWIEAIAIQIMGPTANIEISFSTDSDLVTTDGCNVISPECDVMICLGDLTFANEVLDTTRC